jgi:hypothetical protein
MRGQSGRASIRVVRWVAVLAILGLVPPAWAGAQTPVTRAEALRRAREEKQRTLTPYAPGTLEKTMHVIEDRAIFFLGREGFYPKLGSITTGSGFAYGVGFRDRRILDRRGTLEIWTGASIKSYWAAEARATFPDLAGGRLRLEGYARRHDYPQEDFFGVGPDARRIDHTSFALRSTSVGARAGIRPAAFVLAGAGLEHLQPRIGDGRDRVLPSIGDIFHEATAPGLARQPDFVRASAFLEIDYREPKNARRGGWYRVEASRFHDRAFDAWTFDRLDVDLRQFVGFLAGRRVLAARAHLSTSNVAAGHQVPFYVMPTLGGHDTLRGFREHRFRGPHALLLQGEYRWEIWSGLDAALFYDAGKVALHRSDLGLDGLERDYGFGFRFNTNDGVVMRIDAGFGSREGKHLYIVFGGVF